jgi:hypothetical protein
MERVYLCLRYAEMTTFFAMRSTIVTGLASLFTFAVVGCAETGSPELRGAAAVDRERLACAEVPDRDRDAGILAMRGQIVAVEEVRDKVFPKAPPQLVGVRIDVRATPGVTQQWIGRVIGCHAAHYAVAGAAGAPASPVLVPGARVRVSSTADGFRISITSDDLDVARQALSAGRALWGS